MYSTTYTAVIVMVLANFLPKIGVEIGNDALTTTVSVLLTIGAALWALFNRHKFGGVTWYGKRK